ncbi:hypothetical protein [Virgibacillus salinus]|uniref:Uncharacterized protein n=1 Tax=Virgibacillus salinus TaxID=553311 RepID=A0A1H1DXK7_9BACI|nr:hypothetical protein [Virgibacillus salinus]SDQ81080.1 hypothetical protein SAMN05216231_2622 [Virgibacillus salinus]
MSEKVEIDKPLIKLKENNYDLTELTSTELETLLKYFPEIIKAINNMGEVGSKSQEKVYSTIDKAIEIFSEQLKDPSLSEEARDKLNDRIERMVEKSYQKDSEFKRWMVASVWVGVGGATLALAGKNPEMRKAALKLLTKGKPI